MEKRSYFVILPAAFVYFLLLGFTEGQFFPGKVFIVIIIILIRFILILVHVFGVGLILLVLSFARKRRRSARSLIVFTDKLD